MTKYYNIEIDYDKDKLLTDYARDMLLEFYSVPGEKSPQELYARACVAWSTYHGVADYELAQRLYGYVSNRWFMFASPVLSNAPTQDRKVRGMPISCFLGYVPDTIPGLIDHSTELRWLSVMGGGVGGHWGDVRSVSDIAPGPIPFIHTVDADMAAYKQGKTRKGSYAAYMRIDHPDILEFINIRIPTGDVNRKAFNIHNAVNVTDAFMEAVKHGSTYELVDSKTGPTGEFLDARAVWNRLIETRFRTGEPYLNFIDRANEYLNPYQKAAGLKVHGSNLCNEIHLATDALRTAVCCLSSANAEFYPEWCNTLMIQDLVTMLDNVLEYFIENASSDLGKAVYSAIRERSIGIGCMGFHNLLQRRGFVFESEPAVIANQILFKHIKDQAVIRSKELALERGEPADIQGSGMRHAHLLAIAPNASSGVILGTSPSIEPNKANAYTHRTRAGSVLVINSYLKELLHSLGKDTPEVWSDIITNGGSIQHLDFLDDHTKRVFKTSFELDQKWIVKHAAARQSYICQGQSVNVFFAAGSPRKYVREVHELAWDSGLKGLYYLRTESKQRAEKISTQTEENKLTSSFDTVVYGKSDGSCPYCNMVTKLLDSKGIEYEYVYVDQYDEPLSELVGRNVRTVPQVFIDGEYIGGYQETYKFLMQSQDVVAETEDECKACEG
jgi:ribonucleoside-diphosphate reductase alpha chain